jgi:hypothetical protein
MLDGIKQYQDGAQFAKTIQDVLAPYDGYIRQYGLTPPQAIAYLLNAQTQLTQGTPESRRAAFGRLGADLGFAAAATETPAAPVDPQVQALQNQMAAIQQNLTARQQADYQLASEQAKKQVETFASDPAHPQFDEVADDIVLLVRAGVPLPEAYEKAIWANPVTREKSLQVRLLAEDAKKAENARLDALPKAKAARAHVRSSETRKTPTEPLGTMEDTLKATYAEIRQRAH